MEIKLATGKLTAVSMDEVFKAFAPVWNRRPGRRKKFILNLENVGFVDPYSAACLCVLLETISGRIKAPPKIIPPKSDAVSHYLSSLGFWRHVSSIADIIGEVDSTKKAVSLDSDVLLELTRIEKVEDINEVTRHLLKIIECNLRYSKPSKGKIINVVSELCCNITDHSDATGWVAAQKYTQPDGGRFIYIGVADGGRGIKDSLGSRFKAAEQWTHQEAILKALTKDISRLPNRGLGLSTVQEIVGEFRGHLHIRSGDYRFFLGSKVGGFPGALFPGVQVSIRLSEHQGA